MTTPASKLLQPITVGPLELKNRIMFPPLTTGYEERDGSIGERSLAFYERLARGGVSYIVIGDVAPVMTASPTPKLATDAQIPTFKALADAVHKHGAKIALQLFHPEYDVPGVGRMVMGSMAAAKAAQEAKAAGDEEAFAAKMAESNEIRKQAYAKLHHDMQHFVNEATVEQLTQIKEAIAASAARAQQAGIDAIEVHGDRLVGSLCSAILNQRTDEYGGSFENRVRYALEVVAAIKEAAPQLMVEYKLPVIMENPDGTPRGKGGLLPDEACEFAKLLEGAGIDMIQVAQANHTGNMGDTIPPMGAMPYNWTLPVAERVKALVSVPVATVGRVVSVEAGEKILEDGSADIVAYGRSLMCDPDIALKAATGEPIRECLNCNKGCVDAIQNRQYISCVLNAENGDEATVAIKPGEGDKKIAVVGGGIAGLEAARVAAVSGIPSVLTCAANAGPAMMGDPVGTAFAPIHDRGSSRRLWIGFAAHPFGTLVADAGAAKAVRGGAASLLAAGVLEVRGEFAAGDAVWIDDEAGNHLAKGLAGFDSEEIPQMLGRNTAQLKRFLGEEYAHPLVHRDNLVLV